MADESKPIPPVMNRTELLVILVKRLCLAESIGRIYSMSHPKGKAAVADAYSVLAAELAARPQLVLTLTEGRILANGQPVEDRNPIVTRFVSAFQQIQVDNLVFSAGLTQSELEEFFGLLLLGAKSIHAQGGLPALLRAKGLSHVSVQQVNYVAVPAGAHVVPTRDTQPLDPATEPPAPADPAETVKVIPFPEGSGGPPRPRRPRPPRVRKPVLNAITETLQASQITGETGANLAVQLGAFFERELGARTRELKRENERVVDELRQLNRVLDQLDLSVVVWDHQGIVTFVHHSAVTMLGLVAGRPLSPTLYQCLRTLDFPLVTPQEIHQDGLTEQDAILLRAVERLIIGAEGQPIAALLRRG